MCKPDPEQTDVVKTWQAPKDVAQLSSFLGFANYYREFIKGYADIAAPLSRLNRKNATWQWGEEEQSAFDKLKEILTSEPVLGLPTDEGMFILDTDASTVAIAGVLSQKQERNRTDSGSTHCVCEQDSEARGAAVWGCQVRDAGSQGIH